MMWIRNEILALFCEYNLPAEVARRLTDPGGDFNYADLVTFTRLVTFNDLREAGLQVAPHDNVNL